MVRTGSVVKLRDLVECLGTQSPSLIAHGRYSRTSVRWVRSSATACGCSLQPGLIDLMSKVMRTSLRRIAISWCYVWQKTHDRLRLHRSERSGRGQTNRQVLQSVDEVRSEARNLSDELGLVRPLHQLLEHDVDLHPREVRAQAVVLSAAAERDVLVRRAFDVEAERIIKDGLIAIR